MHFCVFVARVSLASALPGCAWPMNSGLNWFMPALAKRSVGSSYGTTGEEGTIVCSLLSK